MFNLYNGEIAKTKEIFSNATGAVPLETSQAWSVLENEELILKSDMAMDLGGGEAFGISGILFTTDEVVVPQNQIFTCGPSILELSKLNSEAEINYARFVVIRLKKEAVKNKTSQQLYGIFRKLDYVRYHIFPDGFALRISTVQHREVVRVSKSAVERMIDFESVGTSFINAYSALPEVDAVQIYFLTSLQKSDELKRLDEISRKSNDITESLNEIFKGLKMDCSTCAQKPLCDEIEGLKELHASL